MIRARCQSEESCARTCHTQSNVRIATSTDRWPGFQARILRAVSWAHARLGSRWARLPHAGLAGERFARSSYVNRALFGMSTCAIEGNRGPRGRQQARLLQRIPVSQTHSSSSSTPPQATHLLGHLVLRAGSFPRPCSACRPARPHRGVFAQRAVAAATAFVYRTATHRTTQAQILTSAKGGAVSLPYSMASTCLRLASSSCVSCEIVAGSVLSCCLGFGRGSERRGLGVTCASSREGGGEVLSGHRGNDGEVDTHAPLISGYSRKFRAAPMLPQ